MLLDYMSSSLTKTYSIKNTPGESLRVLFMEPLGITPYRIAKDLALAPIAISHILRGRRDISPSMAVKLSLYFNVPPSFWLELQAMHDLRKIPQKVGADETISVSRCPALEGRKFIIKRDDSQLEVLLIKLKEKNMARNYDGNGCLCGSSAPNR
jgi:addiction module HigA family antidote